jgi:hypothetical protein
MNSRNAVDIQTIWDLEFQALLAQHGIVNLPISTEQWNASAVMLDKRTKELILKPTLDKIWKSIQSNLNTRITKWIQSRNSDADNPTVLPTPKDVIDEAKKLHCMKDCPYLLHTSPFIIKKLCTKINNTLDITNQKQPLCSQRMVFRDFTDNKDVLAYLQNNQKQNTGSFNKQPASTFTDNHLHENKDFAHMVQGNSNTNINNHMTFNISNFGDNMKLMENPIGSFSLPTSRTSSPNHDFSTTNRSAGSKRNRQF